LFGVVGTVERIERRTGSQGNYARLKVGLEGGEERSVFFASTDEPEEGGMPCLLQFIERGIVKEGTHLLFHSPPEENQWFRWQGYKDRYGLWKKGPGVTVDVDRLVPVYEAVPFCRLKGFVTGRLGIEEVTTETSIMGIVRHRILQRHWRLLWGELSTGHAPQNALRVARTGTEDLIDVLSKELNIPDLAKEASTTLSTCEEISNEIMAWTGSEGYFCSEYNVLSRRLGLVGRADFVGLRRAKRSEGRVIEYKITDQTAMYEQRQAWITGRAMLQAATYAEVLREALKIPEAGAEVWIFDKWTGVRAHRHQSERSELVEQLQRSLWARDEYLHCVSSPLPNMDDYGKRRCKSCSFREVCRRLVGYQPHGFLSGVRDGLDWEAEAGWRSFEATSLEGPSEEGVVIPSNDILEYAEERLKVRLRDWEKELSVSPGSFVRLSPVEATHGWGFGVVRTIQQEVMDIALRDPLTPALLSNGKLRLDFSVPVDFSDRAKMAITAIEVPGALTDDEDVRKHLEDLRRAVECASSVKSCAVEADFGDLNESQQRAARMIMASKLTVIHGPFGSGKTTVIARASLELAKLGRKVLVTSYTNNSVDNAMEMIRDLSRKEGVSLKLVRIATGGRPKDADGIRVVDSHHFGRDDLSLMREADVVASTLISCLSNAFRDAYMEKAGYLKLRYLPFDVAIVDEASQCVLPYALIPCLISKRWVLVGDHRQLEPLVLDPRAAGSLTSWFDLAVKDLEESGEIVMLDVQYRCPHEVGSFLSRQFYGSRLRNDEEGQKHDHQPVSVDARARSEEINAKLSRAGLDLQLTPEGISTLVNPRNHLIFIDTAGRSRERGRRSKSNSGEAVVASEAMAILGQATDDLLFLSPYRAQNSLVRRMLAGEVRMGTVDSYQGRQADIVVLSLVRSNANGLLGFLRNVRRLNVAMSRCMKKLVVISDSATIRMNRADLEAREVLMEYIRTSRELGGCISLAPQKGESIERVKRRELALKPTLRGRPGAMRSSPAGTGPRTVERGTT